MTDLLELQRRIAGAVMIPLDASVSAEAKQLVKPNDRLSATERLNIYHRQYWYRLLDSFYEDFPGLCAVLGERAFHRLANAYLTDCPSQSFTLRNLGSHLETWLRQHPEFAGKNLALALDMIRLEWAHIEAFDNAEQKAIGPEDLLELGPELTLALQPHIGLLDLRYPVDNLRIKLNEHLEEHSTASNAVGAPVRHHIVRRFGRRKPQQIFVAVHRVEFTVYYRRLEADEFHLLAAIAQGQPIGAALEVALADSQIEQAELQHKIQTWFANWA
ncbi:MAG: putative DNA-binding domain-containing protein, partial [Bryobacterales bacterium]|nr:putative DNA-binding domain-containing protein [Bryobacterales bacterium]